VLTPVQTRIQETAGGILSGRGENHFETLATYRFVIRKPLKAVWSVIGPLEFEATLPPDFAHHITLDLGGGEHDCYIEGTCDGQPVSFHQERRFIEPSTVTVLARKEGEDQLLTIKLSSWFWLWTRALATFDVRLTTASPPDHDSSLQFQQRTWQLLRTLYPATKAALKGR
jgi:hypothetical protein